MEVHSSHLQLDNVAKKTQRTSVRSQSSLSYPSQTIVKAKLEMTEPRDHDEIEADNAANEIVNGGKISRKISEGSSSFGVRVSTAMESQLSHMQGGGHSMPRGLQSMMESGFGRDFSQVRLHTDSQAAEMSSSINAKAFTLGNDIYFNKGQYNPNTTEGQKLMAHELTHVAQNKKRISRCSGNAPQKEPDPNNSKNEPNKSPNFFSKFWEKISFDLYKVRFDYDKKIFITPRTNYINLQLDYIPKTEIGFKYNFEEKTFSINTNSNLNLLNLKLGFEIGSESYEFSAKVNYNGWLSAQSNIGSEGYQVIIMVDLFSLFSGKKSNTALKTTNFFKNPAASPKSCGFTQLGRL